MALHDLGVALCEVSTWQEATIALDEAVAIRRRLAQDEPERYRWDLAGSLHRSAGVFQTASRTWRGVLQQERRLPCSGRSEAWWWFHTIVLTAEFGHARDAFRSIFATVQGIAVERVLVRSPRRQIEFLVIVVRLGKTRRSRLVPARATAPEHGRPHGLWAS
ncbi:hypothetical protein [Amycolatopsis regifaucium]|uniref:Uncharacterized protein n=1 Tax=Amycolatopsis regifaucium TaxID=546365 RepID=A0A154MK48_9PSEU|nr:hypothetical protein [Amycolatopsis regifaucium]KZB84784.1 hypothetical protein AVL48_31760 [Amycolatopsis regifaucium]OKA05233.1 hypothetical protein ATP06_0227120 [Amycolatopsis regifaucium]SFJ63929.1 hypothetical protein SAMN04489731_12836 [Amycolatopsis regifaucium]